MLFNKKAKQCANQSLNENHKNEQPNTKCQNTKHVQNLKKNSHAVQGIQHMVNP